MKKFKLGLISLVIATASFTNMANASDTYAYLFNDNNYVDVRLHKNGAGNSPTVNIGASVKTSESASISVSQGGNSFYCFVYKRDNEELFLIINDIVNNQDNYNHYTISRSGSTCSTAMTYSKAAL